MANTIAKRPFELSQFKEELEECKKLSLEQLLDKFPLDKMEYDELEKKMSSAKVVPKKNIPSRSQVTNASPESSQELGTFKI